MKKIIGVVFAVLLTLTTFNLDTALAEIFHSSQFFTSGNYGLKCYSNPTPSQCLSIGGTSGNVLSDEMGCFGGANEVSQSYANVGYCEAATACTGNTYSASGYAPCTTCPVGQTANAGHTACVVTTTCPANCPGTYPSCTSPTVAGGQWIYNSSANSCVFQGTTPSGTLTSGAKAVCTGTAGGTCNVSLSYTTNNGVTAASLWQCAANGTGCSVLVSSIPGNSNTTQSATVSMFNSSSAGAYFKLVNGASQSSAILASLYSAGIPQQAYNCTPSGPTFNRYQGGGASIASDPGVNYLVTDFGCGNPGTLALTCPSGTAGTAGLVSITQSQYSCFTFDYSACTCNAAVSCSAGTGSGSTKPSGTYPSCTCPGGQVYNSASNSCACPSGQSWDGGTSTCRTPCPAGSTGTYATSCTCPAPATYNSGTNTCGCPAPRTWNGSSCVCPVGQGWNGSSCQELCPSGTTGTYHPACTCPAPRNVYDTNSRVCICPLGQVYNAGSNTCSNGTPTTCNQNGMSISYTNITSSSFDYSWDCGVNFSAPSTYVWGPNQSTWTLESPTGSYSASGKSPSTAYDTSIWCAHPYSDGVSGDSMSCGVTTLPAAPITVTTNAATAVTANSATMSFTVSGYNSIQVAGAIHVYLSNGTTDFGAGTYTTAPATVNANGAYSMTLASLSCGTTYQFRGEAGATYGSKLSFTTSACPAMTVAWTNMPQTVNYGKSTRMIYSVGSIPSGQTATCDLYDYTGNTEITGVSAQTFYSPSITNLGFESSSIGPDTYVVRPSNITDWIFPIGTAGVLSRKALGGPTSDNTAFVTTPPEGMQAAFVAGGSVIYRDINLSAGQYLLKFKSANRGSGYGQQTIGVGFDSIRAFTYSPVANVYNQYSVVINATVSGSHSLTFTGQTADDFNSAFVDDIEIIPINGANTAVSSFYINPSPATLPVNPAGYGYIVKCTVPTPSTTSQSSVSTVTVITDGSPTAALTPLSDGTLEYSCPSGAVGMRLKSTGGYTQSLSGGQYVYANATTPQIQSQQYLSRFKSDFLNNSISGQPITTLNSFYDRNDNNALTGADLLVINGSLVTSPITASLFASYTGGNAYGVAVGPDGWVYTPNWTAGAVYKNDPSTGAATFVAGGLGNPTGLAFDKQGNLFVSNFTGGTILKITSAGVVSTYATGINQPIGIAVDSYGNLFVAQQTLNKITKILPNGTSYEFASGMNNVNGIAIDSYDNVYVAAQFANTIYKITPNGTVTTYATMSDPLGLAIDTSGNLFASSYGGGTVSKIDTSGTVTTIITGLANPNSISLGSTGYLYVGVYSGGSIYRTNGYVDTYPQTFSGGATPVIQNADYTLECYGAYGTLPATATYSAANLEVKYLNSSALYPQITAKCPATADAYTITRTPIWGTTYPAWRDGSIWNIANLDNTVALGTATTTYSYALDCRDSGGTLKGLVTNSINVPPAVSVNNMNTPAVASGTPATVTWRSDGNSCDLVSYDGTVWTGDIPGNPISGGYQYSFTMTPTHPNFTWLNSSRLGANAVGWGARCRDTSAASRLTTTKMSTIQVYKPTVATITPPDTNSNLRFTCNPDFDYMDIKRNGTSLSSYPKTWNINQTSSYSVLVRNMGGDYELVCKTSSIPGNIDNAYYPNTGLSVYGSIGGNSAASIPTTAVVTGTTAQTTSTTNDGLLANLSYDIRNATTWSVQYFTQSSGGSAVYNCNQAGTGCVGTYSMYRLNSGNSSVSINSSLTLPDMPLTSGGRWVITASDGVTTKTLTLILANSATAPTGSMLVIPNPVAGIDAYDLVITCDNSVSYNLYNTSFPSNPNRDLVTYGSLTSGGSMTNRVSYNATNSNPSLNYAPVRLECVNGAQTFTDEKNVPINSRTPATVNKFSVYPQTVVCGGGKVAVSWSVANPIGKNCTLDATTTKPVSQYPAGQQAGIVSGITTAKTRILGNYYVRRGASANGTDVRSGESMRAVFDSVDVNGNSVGELPLIPIRDNTKFNLSCVHQGVTTTVSIDARTACQGEQ